MRFPKLGVLVFVFALALPTAAQAQAGTAQGFATRLEPGPGAASNFEPIDLAAAVREVAAELVQSQGLGLVEGVDYVLVPAGTAVDTPSVDSVLMTRAALDKMLDQIETMRNRVVAQQDALDAAQELILTRDQLLEAVNEKTAGERWYIRAIQVGGGLAAGFLMGQTSNDTVVIR